MNITVLLVVIQLRSGLFVGSGIFSNDRGSYLPCVGVAILTGRRLADCVLDRMPGSTRASTPVRRPRSNGKQSLSSWPAHTSVAKSSLHVG